ncbi:hypothetical protein E0I74_26895 [Rhizobium laguerreae]|uniref:hypothetical protein n=1 Tax=Rhizobium laguerreae TaxID=1076926 RepID=UPI00103C83E2|nr:hypothetical protein [Rhizobium laguerreae]MBY3249916.1 hypothetical protein [Rhizobium laguerreae]MBY3531215.1 hypothetical protein [Rhizobium laguerreae]TBX74465.1 hypothetical protein E0I74_26895 [Rhizobium laguerreae]
MEKKPAPKAKNRKKAVSAAADIETGHPPQPTYLTGEDPINVDLHVVAQVMKLIANHEQTSAFCAEAKKLGAFVTVSPRTINFVKDFIAAHEGMRLHPTGVSVVNPRGVSRDYDCDFGG